jgi:hypothetical protein
MGLPVKLGRYAIVTIVEAKLQMGRLRVYTRPRHIRTEQKAQ